MTTVFVSDLHLSDQTPAMVQLFCSLLKECQNQATALYILGDFFDAWVGDDVPDGTAKIVITALREATSAGLPVAIQHGNRDFLLGKRFFAQTGCTLLPEEYLLNLHGQPVLLMHGDSLCTDDLAYQRFRKRSRTFLAKSLFLLRSRTKRQAIAAHYREKSREHTAMTAESIMDVTQNAVVAIMQKHHTLHLIHGHTHRPAEHVFLLQEKEASRTVLPAWHGTGGALICLPDGSRKTVFARPGTSDTFLGPTAT